jgi:LuxR family maltose regulon positive regulatory protein
LVLSQGLFLDSELRAEGESRIKESKNQLTAILQTKLFIPPLQDQVVLRPQLFARLDQGLEGKMILVSAPPGFGKTTLLSAWIHTRQYTTAWLSLDFRDNDIARFGAYLQAAFQQIAPGRDQAPLSLPSHRQVQPVEDLLTGLVHDLEQRLSLIPPEGGPLLLVLDDYQEISAPEIHEAVEFLLSFGPQQLALVLATRHDPEIPLARLRLEGALLEFRAVDLRFSQDEIAAFFSREPGYTLNPDHLSALETRTEGWVAGLQIAALALQGQADTEDTIRRLTGSHQYLLAYLSEEVLDRQPVVVRDFLLQTSILERLNASLCKALTGHPESAVLLPQLSKANLFLTPLDAEGIWFRYHPLFASFLQSLLQQRRPELVPDLHRAAARWLETHNQPDKGVEHALTAGDTALATRLIGGLTRGTLRRGEYGTIKRWLAALPEPLLLKDTYLGLAQAWVLLFTGPQGACEAWLDQIAGSPAFDDRAVRGEIYVLRMMAASSVGDMDRTLELGELALRQLPGDEVFLRITAVLAIGYAYRFTGMVTNAVETFEDALALSQKEQNIPLVIECLSNLSNQYLLRGDLGRAQETLEQAFRVSPQPMETITTLASEAYILRGVIHYEKNELVQARVDFQRGIDLSSPGGLHEMLYAGHLWMARTLQAQGNMAAAHEQIAISERYAALLANWRINIHVRAARVRLALAEGDDGYARRWAARVASIKEKRPQTLHPIEEYETVTLALVHLHTNQAETAVEILTPVISVAVEAGRMGHAYELQILQALAFEALGQPEAALGILKSLLPAVANGGYVRLFLDAGLGVVPLLKRASDQGIEVGYIRRLLSAAEVESNLGDQPDIHLAVARLTARELEVLGLVEAGFSNDEIARALQITTGTVKRHLYKIFRKLGVKNRTQAVAQARALK